MIGLIKDIAEFCPKDGALMGLDVGKKTIGLAVCPAGTSVVTPLFTIKRKKFSVDAQEILKTAKELEVSGYVLGYPVNMDGSEGPRAQSIRDFAAEFEKLNEIRESTPFILF